MKNQIIETMTNNTNEHKLYRTEDGILAGVCGGLARFFGLNVSLIRIVTLLLILCGGLSIWVYIILWLVVPKAPRQLNE